MHDEKRVEIVDEWHYWDGFVDGLVRIDGIVFYANCITDVLEDGTRSYRARSLFHLLYPLVRFGATMEGAQADPGLVAFSESELVPAAPLKETPEREKANESGGVGPKPGGEK